LAWLSLRQWEIGLPGGRAAPGRIQSPNMWLGPTARWGAAADAGGTTTGGGPALTLAINTAH
jgi:hypothetical protein